MPIRARPPGRAARAVVLGLAVLALLGAPDRARAAPMDDPHVGGLTFSGPTSGTLAAVYWNPAALGLVRGLQITVAGTGRVTRTTVNRTPIDPTTGVPAGSASLAPGNVTATDVTDFSQWPTGPGAFFGISTDFGGDRFTLAFATYSPFIEQGHFPAAADGSQPTRYFRVDTDLRNLALVPALAVRIGSDLRVGLAPGFIFSTGRFSFDEDIPGGSGSAEDPNNAARYDISSGQSITDSRVSFTLAGGLYYRYRSVEMGLAYSSRPFGTDVAGVEIGGDKTTVTRPPRLGGGPVTCVAGQASRCVFGDVVYHLPDIWTLGLTWHSHRLPGLEVSGIVRWVWLHVQDRIDIRLTSPALQADGLPDHIVFHRGLKDVWDTRLRVAYWLREWLRVGATLRFETSAVDAGDVNPATVDGFKVEPIVLAEVRLTRRLALTAGYGFTYMPAVTAHPSNFDPRFAGQCAAAGQSLDDPSCIAQRNGLARPTADGTYSRTVHDFTLAVTARF